MMGMSAGGGDDDPPPDAEAIQRMLRRCADKGRVDWSVLRPDTHATQPPAADKNTIDADDDDTADIDNVDSDALGSAVYKKWADEKHSKICFGKVWCATLLLVKIWVACANSDIEQYILLRHRQRPQVFFSFAHITRQFFSS